MILGRDGLITKVQEKGDNVEVTHFENINPTLRENYIRRNDGTNGFSKDKSVRRIGTVPFLTWLEWARQDPGLMYGDREYKDKAVKKLLKQNPMFMSVEKGL